MYSEDKVVPVFSYFRVIVGTQRVCKNTILNKRKKANAQKRKQNHFDASWIAYVDVL